MDEENTVHWWSPLLLVTCPSQIGMCFLNRDILDVPTHSRNTTFPKLSVKYKHNLSLKVRVSSSRHPNAREGHSGVVLHRRRCGSWGGDDTFPSGGSVSKGKSAPIWLLQGEALLACVRQEQNTLTLEGIGYWEVKCGQPSPTGTSGVLQSKISLLSVLCCILWRSGPAASVVAKS